ncbi:MAG: DUF4145 domain-containing protein [Chloroflexi bacterium]|nr:DUF4145 domain-containing protein [Chloroflexota bacterium]
MEQVPGAPFGRDVSNLPADIERLYQEARDCMKACAYTCAVLACRKMLLHVAVNMGAPIENLKFVQCVDYLETRGYVPPNARGWIDRIRDKGNEANHEINIMSKQEAEDIISLVEMLLMIVYDYPSRA